MAACLTIAAVILTPFAIVDWPSAAPSGGAFASVVVLGLVCTALALVLMAILIGAAGPARASVITYINPVIALGLGIAFLGESPGAGSLIGLVLILIGSWISTRGSSQSTRSSTQTGQAPISSTP
jgi:drug/metabolite transporter (DMT)-like permease